LAKAKAASKKQQTYEEVELQTINEVGVQLGNFFDIQAQLNNYYASLEAESKEHYDPTQNTSKKAIERALVELQMENLDAQIREQMTVYAPVELKAIYTRFLKMYAKIQQEQEFARAEEVKKLRLQRWKQEQEEIWLIEITSGVIAVTFISLIFGWLMWQLQNLSGGF
jgi:nitric oxide synthase oxygenase domain/subunit